MKQTAVEYLVKDLTSILKEIPTSEIQNTSITYAVKKALKIEKIQIKYYFKNGAKWQQERSYSDEEVENILTMFYFDNPSNVSEWFEQFKKK
jgi:hypothetical protein